MIDIEGDEYSLTNWSVKESSTPVDWILQKSPASQSEVVFSFNPPLNAPASRFTLELNFTDENISEPQSSLYSVPIIVEMKEEDKPAFDPSTLIQPKKDARVPEKFPFEFEQYRDRMAKNDNRTVTVRIEEPSPTGLMEINFSDYISLPANISQWNSTNDGHDRLSINYLPNEKTQTIVEE